jgi:Domain of unknown function (DUF4105)
MIRVLESLFRTIRNRVPSLQRRSWTIATWFVNTLAWSSVGTFFFWSTGAIWYLDFLPNRLAAVLATAFLIAGVAVFYRLKNKSQWLTIGAVAVLAVYLVTLIQRPANERDWDPSQQLATRVQLHDQHVRIDGFRHCVYRSESDYDVHYQSYEFDLDQLTAVYFLVQRFSALEGLAHTFISFQLQTPDGPKYFSVSVEVRREVGEVYSPLRGLYRQYELLYVVGDERDIIGVRTVMRKEDRVHMYRVNATPQDVQQLFVDVAQRINKLADQPEFYHTLLNNCTNGIVFHTYDLTPEPINWLDPRIVIAGYSDRFAFSQRLIGDGQQSFEQLRAESRIDERAKRIGLTPEFSAGLRAQNR